ncbi:sodium/proline symporter [Luminiphilus syltensis NOR5-1B]|uniref:Sodium/proline symporter n=1 Tax=Luminiphilus syltensis NOR5-1B TaxID=565045 RepID=B8KRM4_9GAMM|nr:sodium/proline symporter PutP [Luminiphilus syltensis]EED35653.1 sodium/proline symporter [Luminiphilus syltensis NOR5-1B]
MVAFDAAIAATFLFYLAIIFAIAVVAWMRTRTAADYYLGGRNLSPAVAALSAGASDTSGWVLLGLPGYAYLSGLEAGWLALGLCLGVAMNWLLTARKLRIFSHALEDAVTLPTYLQRRFCDSGGGLRIVSSLFILLFFLFYVSSGLIGGGKLFVAVFGVDYHIAVILGAVIIIVYTLFGGFLAVSWTDVFQGLLLTIALLVVPVMAIQVADGLDASIAAIEIENPWLLEAWHDKNGEPLGAIAIISLLGWGLGYFGQPHILSRFKAIESAHAVKSAAAIGIIWAIVVYIAAIVVGMAGIAVFDTALADAEKVFILLVGTLFNPFVAGVLLAAILAAIMSTVDSQLLVCSSALAEDIYPLLRKRAIDATLRLRIGRWAVGGVAVASTLIAMDSDSKVLDVVSYAWAGLGAALGPTILLSLYWARMTGTGALAGVVTGGLTVIIWSQIDGGIFEAYELIPGFIFASFAIVLGSWLSAGNVAEAENRYRELDRA